MAETIMPSPESVIKKTHRRATPTNGRGKPRTAEAERNASFGWKIEDPRYRVTPLPEFVRETWPDAFRESCEYRLEGRSVIREKRFLGELHGYTVVGILPEPLRGGQFATEEFTGWVVGHSCGLQKLRHLERNDWKNKRRIRCLFGGIEFARSMPRLPLPSSEFARSHEVVSGGAV